jgi:hypothetical protein
MLRNLTIIKFWVCFQKLVWWVRLLRRYGVVSHIRNLMPFLPVWFCWGGELLVHVEGMKRRKRPEPPPKRRIGLFFYTMSNDVQIFRVITPASMKMAVFWNVVLCNVVEVYRCFRGACCLLIALMMEAANTSETSVSFYQTARRNIPEGCHLQS